MRTKRHISYSIPIPANIPPSFFVAAFQTYIPFMTNHQTIIQFTEVKADPSQIGDDPFFGPWDSSFRAFTASDFVHLAPRMTKTITYHILFQATSKGIRSRAAAPAGVTIRSEYSVRPRPGPTSPAGSDSTGSSVTAVADEYEICEDMEVEANSLLMPFVTDKALAAHRHIVMAVIKEASKGYFGELVPIPWEHDQSGAWRRIEG